MGLRASTPQPPYIRTTCKGQASCLPSACLILFALTPY